MKKIELSPVMLGVVTLCIVAVMAAGGYKILNYRGEIKTLKTTAEMQNQTIATLTTERDSCKAATPTCPSLINEEDRPKSEVEEALEPEEDSDYQSKIDALKKRYEEMLVTYFVLKKCSWVAATDYHVITSALSQEMASLNAPGRLQYDILTSAEGSYNELYSGNQCDKETIGPLQEQYKTFLDAVTEQFTPQ